MKRIAALFTALLLACLIAGAQAEASMPEGLGRYLGEWANDDYRMYVRVEEDEIYVWLNEVNGDYVWEFDHSFYDGDEDQLCLTNYERYRQVIDWDTMELLQEDWSLGDMLFASLAFGDDEDTLIAADIPYIDEPLTLCRVVEEEDDGF